MSEAKPKRKFWQFHLSTAVALMLASGSMLALNVLAPSARLADDAFITFNYIQAHKCGVRYFGWPEYAIAVDFQRHMISNGTALIIDSGIALVVIGSVACACEFLIRRREARKT